MDKNSDEYQQGLRDGRMASLEDAVRELAVDMKRMKQLVFSLYGAIALVAFIPELMELINVGR